jgi:hypothetical protein
VAHRSTAGPAGVTVTGTVTGTVAGGRGGGGGGRGGTVTVTTEFLKSGYVTLSQPPGTVTAC